MALSKQVGKLPSELWRSLARDRGMEMAKYKRFTIAAGVDIYFCDAQIPWQRGTSENTNRLPRRYLPKGTNGSGYSQPGLNKIALRFDRRPRKALEFQMPADKLHAVLQ